jgi:RNA polymerase sigma factor (sigma-70 family)
MDSYRPAYFGRLLKFLRKKGKSREDAEDLIQEAMLRLHVYAKTYAVQNTESFLRQAVHNLAIDQYRRDRLRLRRESQLEDVDRRGQLIALGPTPDQILDYQQRLDALTALLDAVNPRTREIYFAHRFGYTYAEIADHMGIAEITVHRHMTRALLTVPQYGKKAPGKGTAGAEAKGFKPIPNSQQREHHSVPWIRPAGTISRDHSPYTRPRSST